MTSRLDHINIPSPNPCKKSVSGQINMAAAVLDCASARKRASDKTVFIRRLPYDLTDKALEDAVSHVGPVKSCFTVKERGA